MLDAFDVDALRIVAQKAECLSALASSCRVMRAICDEIAPGLKLNLHMHQRAALKWMLTQERPRPAEPHPFQRTFTLQPQLHSVVLHCEIGRLSSSASTAPQLVRSDQCFFIYVIMLSKYVFGYVDPINILFFLIKIFKFRVDLIGTSAKTTAGRAGQ